MQSELKDWLFKVYDGRPPNVAYLEPESIAYLSRLAALNTARDRQATALAASLRQQTEELRAQAARTQALLEGCHLSTGTLPRGVRSCLEILTSASVVLGTPDASLANLSVALTDLDKVHHLSFKSVLTLSHCVPSLARSRVGFCPNHHVGDELGVLSHFFSAGLPQDLSHEEEVKLLHQEQIAR